MKHITSSTARPVDTSTAPSALPVQIDRIPQELRAERKWVCWRYTWVSGHWAKVPYNPKTGGGASTTNPLTWSTFEDATKGMSSYDGIGYVIEAGSGIVGIDFDDCRDPLSGVITESVLGHLSRLRGYAEVSPSETGLKLLTRAHLVGSYVDHTIGIEVYTGKRYFTVTGSLIEGHEALPEEPQDLEWFIETVFKKGRDGAGQDPGRIVVKQPLEGWPLERVREELLPSLSSEGYHNWLLVGMALHHQGGGAEDWLELWDQWSQGGSTYRQGVCAQKWKGFQGERAGSRGAVTLATLIQTAQRATMTNGFESVGSGDGAAIEARNRRSLDPKDVMGIARAFRAQHFQSHEGSTLIRSKGLWYQHTGPHYEEREQEALRAALWTYLDQAIRGDGDGWGDPFKPTKAQIDSAIDALRGLAHREGIAPPVWLPESGMDLVYAPKDIISLSNGLLHLPERRLLSHTSQFFTVNSLPYAYDPNGIPTNWLKFLDQLWPNDPESRDTLQEIFGYLLTADTSQQKMFIIIGPKRSGKGTIGRVLKDFVGQENYVGPTLSSLTSQFGLQPLIGKLVALIADARLGSQTNVQAVVERLLTVSGEDSTTVDRKHKDPWTGTLTARFVFLSNEVPQLADASGALHSRFITLSLRESFFGREDLGLTTRLLKELPAIFTWALTGWSRLQARGSFIQPKTGLAIADELEQLSSPISTFLQEKCDLGPGFTVEVTELYEAWRSWCMENGTQRPCTKQTFGKYLHAAVPHLEVLRPRDKDGVPSRRYQGVRLKEGSGGGEI